MLNNNAQTVAAVVVTYNRKKLLDECLQALLRQTRSLNSIIIIDNASTDGTPEFLQMKEYLSNPKIDYIRLNENTGGAGGFHEGVKRGSEKGFGWLWLMDDDAEPKDDALEKLFLSGLQNISDTVAISSLKIDIDGNIQKIHRGFYKISLLKATPLNDNEYNQPTHLIHYSSFVGILIRSNAVSKIGLPRKDFFIWLDDVEYCLRLSKIGKLFIVRNSIIKHKDRIIKNNKIKSKLPLKDCWKTYYNMRNQLLILNQHKRNNIELFQGYFVGLSKLIIKMLVVILFDNSKYIRLKFLLKGFYDGCSNHSGKRVDPKNFFVK